MIRFGSEKLILTDKQISVQLISTTDIPVAEPQKKDILHGENFQAMAATLARETHGF